MNDLEAYILSNLVTLYALPSSAPQLCRGLGGGEVVVPETRHSTNAESHMKTCQRLQE